MTERKTRRSKEHVDVVVVVNHDGLTRGERGTVELSDTVRRRLDRGYLRLADDADPVPATGVAPLGGNAAAGTEPRGVLLGVDVVTTGGGSDAAGGTGTAAD